MYNELNVLKFQVELAIEDFEKESTITVMYDRFNGSYVSHVINEINDSKIIGTIKHRHPHLKVWNSTLGEIYTAVIDEMNSRID